MTSQTNSPTASRRLPHRVVLASILASVVGCSWAYWRFHGEGPRYLLGSGEETLAAGLSLCLVGWAVAIWLNVWATRLENRESTVFVANAAMLAAAAGPVAMALELVNLSAKVN